MWVLVWLSDTKIWRKSKTLCYMNTDSSLVYIKAEDVYSDVETRFDRPFPKESDWFNKRGIRWENIERICCIKSKNI